MKSAVILLFGLLAATQGVAVGKVDSSFDKQVNFAALRTYAWTSGIHADRPDVHKMIVAAVDDEMAIRGFKQVATGADVTVAYYTGYTTEVDLKALDKQEREGKGGATPTKALGRLSVKMRSAASREEVWSAATRELLNPDPAKLSSTIQAVTARLFETYPKRK
jgi:hypothetical protein